MSAGSIVGSVFSIAAVAGGAFLLREAVIGYNTMIETATINRIQTAVNETTAKYVLETTKNAAEAERTLTAQKAGFEAQERQYVEKINAQFRDIEDRIRQSRDSVDNQLMLEFGISLCKVAAGGDHGARKACDLHTAESIASLNSPFLSITSNTIEDWDALCEQTGEKVYCDYAVTSIRSGPLRDLLVWVRAVDTVIMSHEANYDTLVGQIQAILEMPGPEISN